MKCVMWVLRKAARYWQFSIPLSFIAVSIICLLFSARATMPALAMFTHASAPPTAIPPPPTTTKAFDVRQEIMAVFGPTYGPGAIKIAICESNLNPNAYNPIIVWVNGTEQHAGGYFQILQSTWDETPYRAYSRFDPILNVKGAYWLFKRDGYRFRLEWSTWQCAGY